MSTESVPRPGRVSSSGWRRKAPTSFVSRRLRRAPTSFCRISCRLPTGEAASIAVTGPRRSVGAIRASPYSPREEPRSISFLGESDYDEEGRALVADFGDYVLVSAYFPNSQEGGARIEYKIGFCDSILALCDGIVASGRHVIVAGDYNIAHKPIDLANPKANEGNPGYLPEERAWMDKYLSAGFADTFRHFNAEPGQYTWWTYRVPGARERNIGWRLDYHCVDEGFLPSVQRRRNPSRSHGLGPLSRLDRSGHYIGESRCIFATTRPPRLHSRSSQG